MKILHISANPKPAQEASSKQVTEAFLSSLRENRSDAEVITVDLYKNQPPFYGYESYRNFWYPVFVKDYKPTKAEAEASKYALEQCRLFNEADVLLLTAPMWNFSMPAILKAWLDQVLAPGQTFEMGAGGLKPKHRIKKAILLTSSGGAYAQGDTRDALTLSLKAALGFVQIKDVEIVSADGQNGFFFKDSAERKSSAIQKARELTKQL